MRKGKPEKPKPLTRQTGIERLAEVVIQKENHARKLRALYMALPKDFAKDYPEADEALWYLLNRK